MTMILQKIETYDEVAYMPSYSVLNLYKEGYVAVAPSFLQRFLLLPKMSHEKSIELIQSAVYGAFEYYIAHEVKSQGSLILNNQQTLDFNIILQRYLGRVKDSMREMIATAIIDDLIQSLQRKNFDLATGFASSSGTSLVVYRK